MKSVTRHPFQQGSIKTRACKGKSRRESANAKDARKEAPGNRTLKGPLKRRGYRGKMQEAPREKERPLPKIKRKKSIGIGRMSTSRLGYYGGGSEPQGRESLTGGTEGSGESGSERGAH